MIEKVARKLAEHAGASSIGFRFEESRAYWEIAARIAIETMREPTQVMLDAWGGIPDEPAQPTDDDVCRYGWQQMIDAALKEKP